MKLTDRQAWLEQTTKATIINDAPPNSGFQSPRVGCSNKRGFTLIELSIVLVILGLIVGTMAPLFVSMSKKNKVTGGRKTVETARDEIKGDFLQNRTLASDLTNIGHTIDPWQNNLVYIPAPNLAGTNICTWLAGGTSQTGLAVCLDGDCAANKKDNIAFIVASIGANFNRQIEVGSNLDGNGADIEVRLYSYGTTIDRYTTAPDLNDSSQQFDDIVEYVSVDELIQMIKCSVTVENQTGQMVCSGGAGVANGADIGVINYDQTISIGATSDNCMTIDNSCQLTFTTAQQADTNNNNTVSVTSIPPACSLSDI